MSKKISSHWYSVTSESMNKTKTLENGCLFSRGRYPTSITAKDLPEWFAEVNTRGMKYIDAKNVVDVIYKPNYHSDNHLYKDDFLYISYDKPITLNESSVPGWAFYEGYDVLLWGWAIRSFVDAALKYTEGELHKKFEEIDQKLKEKIVWYVHMNPDHMDYCLEEYRNIPVECTLVLRPMEALCRPMTMDEQKEALVEFCKKRNYTVKDIISVSSAKDLEHVAEQLPTLRIDDPIRPIFLFARTNVWSDKPDDVFEQEICRVLRREKATVCEVFVRKETRSVKG